VAAAIAALSCLPGCGGGPKLVPVSGVVTLNGKPLGDAEIVFIPHESNKDGLPGNDKTGPEGNYKAMTQGRSGLVAGKYRVVVSKVPAPPSAASDSFKDDPYMAKLSAQGPEEVDRGPSQQAPKGSGEIKGEFEDREVPAGGGTLDFDVKASTAKS